MNFVERDKNEQDGQCPSCSFYSLFPGLVPRQFTDHGKQKSNSKPYDGNDAGVIGKHIIKTRFTTKATALCIRDTAGKSITFRSLHHNDTDQRKGKQNQQTRQYSGKYSHDYPFSLERITPTLVGFSLPKGTVDSPLKFPNPCV